MRIDKNRIRLILPDSMEAFGDWVINNDDGTATIQLNTTKVADAQKVQAQYDGAPEPPLSKTINIKEIQYTVTVLDGVNQSVISSTKYDKGSSMGRPSNPSKTGYTFADFYMDSTFNTVATFPMTITGDVTIYAKFNINSYACKVMDGSQVISTETLNYGTNWTPVQPDKPGFNKKGIYLDSEFNTVATLPIFVDNDKTVYLKYKDASIVKFYKDKYKLASDLVAEFSIDNGTTMNGVDIPAGLTYPNLTWGGWGYGTKANDFSENVVINSPLDVFGRWTPHDIHFDVVFDSNGGQYNGGKTEITVRGTTNTALVAPTDAAVLAGKDFLGYNLDKLEIVAQHTPGSNVYEPNATPEDPNRRYFAIYKRTPGEVSINMMSNEDDKFKTVTGIEGENILLDGVPVKPGFDFREWAKNPAGDPPTYGPNTNAVVWVVKLYDGADLISSTAYFEGDKVTPVEPTKADKNFVGWFREPTFQTRIDVPFTINRSIDAFAKFADKVTVNITYKTPDGRHEYVDQTELGMPYAVTNCLPNFKDVNEEPIIIHKWKYMNGETPEEYYPGQAFPHEINGPIEFTAIPIEENIVKPEVGAIYLYGESEIENTNPKRLLYTYDETGIDEINTVQQSTVDAIVEDYVKTTGKAAVFKGFKRVTYEQYSGPSSIYTIGDRLSQVGDTIGTYDGSDISTAERQPTYVLVAVIEAGENSAYVTFNTAGGTPDKIDDQIVAVGSRISAPATPTKVNAKFKGWSTDKTADKIINLAEYVIPVGTTSLELTAIWQNSYEIEFDTVGGTPTVLPIRAYEDEVVAGIPTNLTKEGHTFAGWTYNGDLIDSDAWRCPIGGPTAPLVAKWETA